MVTISPPVEGITIRPTNHEIMICCGVPEQTSYQVTISPELCDVYGQFLEQPATVTFQVGQNEPYLYLPFYGLATLNPTQKAQLPIYSCGLEAVQVQIFEVTPSDWPSFERFTSSIWNESIPDLPSPPGRLLETQQVKTHGGQVNDLKQTLIQLDRAFATGFGHRVILIQPAGTILTEPTELKQAVWVQATHLAGELTFERSQFVAEVHSLLDGKPLAATQVTFFPRAICQKTDSKGQVSFQSRSRNDETQFFVFQKGSDSLILSQRTIVQLEDQSQRSKWSSLSNLIEISTERVARSYGYSRGVGSPAPCNSF
ncbi:MAG: hypothetical protein HY774_07945 [Acidobacteria bacterium]|nr:hypothetical protein [Acidobacteriota bacterium]